MNAINAGISVLSRKDNKNYFVPIQPVYYFRGMKAIFTLLIGLFLVACSKPKDEIVYQAKPDQAFFSRILYYKDSRPIPTDTIYTFPVTTTAMLDSCKKWNGRTISDNVVGTTIDKLWYK